MALKNISFPMLIGAIVIGLLAAFLSVVYLKYKERELEARLKGPDNVEIQIVVASEDLGRGTVLSPANLAVRPIPAEFVHPSAVTPDNFDVVEGRLLIQPLAKGRPLLMDFISGGTAKDFSDIIQPGRRAVTFQVDELNAIGGHARPGNRIDIYAMLPSALKGAGLAQDLGNIREAVDRISEAQGKIVIPVLQDVTVLATGPSAHGEFEEKYSRLSLTRATQQKDNFTTLTIDVSPQQAALLAQAEEFGDLYTLLRNRNDNSTAGFSELTPASLFENARRMKSSKIKINTKGLKEIAPGIFETADGKIITADGKELVGMSVNEKGEIVTSTGEVLDPSNIVVKEDGTVTTASGETIAGVRAEALKIGDNGELLSSTGEVIAGVTAEVVSTLEEALDSKLTIVEFIAGGNSKDGVAVPGILPVIGDPANSITPGEAQ